MRSLPAWILFGLSGGGCGWSLAEVDHILHGDIVDVDLVGVGGVEELFGLLKGDCITCAIHYRANFPWDGVAGVEEVALRRVVGVREFVRLFIEASGLRESDEVFADEARLENRRGRGGK